MKNLLIIILIGISFTNSYGKQINYYVKCLTDDNLQKREEITLTKFNSLNRKIDKYGIERIYWDLSSGKRCKLTKVYSNEFIKPQVEDKKEKVKENKEVIEKIKEDSNNTFKMSFGKLVIIFLILLIAYKPLKRLFKRKKNNSSTKEEKNEDVKENKEIDKFQLKDFEKKKKMIFENLKSNYYKNSAGKELSKDIKKNYYDKFREINQGIKRNRDLKELEQILKDIVKGLENE